MNIYQRINQVRKKIDYIKKDAAVQGYMAVTHDAVTAMLREHLIANGIIVLPSLVSGESVDAGKTKNGAQIIRFEGVYNIRFVNCEEGDDFTITVPGHANDSGDKAPGKSLSYAVKSGLLKVFSIETGVNDESRMEDERRGKLVIEHLKEELQEYLDAGDSLAILLFSRKLGEDAWADLYNSAPDGQKVAFKKRLTEHLATGQDVLAAVSQALLSEDGLMAKENLQDVTEGGKRMLWQHIGKAKGKQLGELVK